MNDEQGCEWLRLYRRIKTLLKQHGKVDYESGLEIADFLLVQDNWGGPIHQVEVHSLHMLQPEIVKSLQGLLRDYPEWEIVVRVDVPGKEGAWPGMGLTIYADSICDALKREYLPAEYRDLAYEGAVPFDPNEQPAATSQRNEPVREALGDTSGNPASEEWRELYERTKRALEPFGKDNEAGGDYFVIDLAPNDKVQMVELHSLHMLRPEIMKSLQAALADFPNWKIEICAICPEEKTIIDVESGLILHHDKIFDALDREALPPKYRFVYEGSRRPPGGFNP